MDHLVCFAPGMFALGYHTSSDKNSDRAKRDLKVAKQLMYTCWQMYERMETGIAAVRPVFLYLVKSFACLVYVFMDFLLRVCLIIYHI